jgi:chromosome partitioning protein
VFSAYKTNTTETPYHLKQEEKIKADAKTPPKIGDPRKIISISNQKGGVAKTTTCLNLGISLALLKKRVLLIDFDVQSNLTASLGYKNTKSFYDVIQSGQNGLPAIINKTRYQNLWLLPANSKMVMLNKKYFGIKNFEYLLRERLNPIKEQYDYILIDTPPSIEFLTLNALTSSNFVIIPSPCEYLSTHGINQIEKIVKIIKKKANPALDYKVLITMYDKKSTSSNVIYNKLKETYSDKRFNTIIDHDEKVIESQIMSRPVICYDKNSRSGLQYISLAKEFISDSKKN